MSSFSVAPAAIHLWRVNLAAADIDPSSLSPDESARAARFITPYHRQRYTVAHVALRDILSRYTATPPLQVDFHFNSYGKPALTNEPAFEFNLSHSGDAALVAVTRSFPLGVDLEQIRPDVDVLALAARFFSAPEAAPLAALPPAARVQRFFEIWSRKEAFIKAIGIGITYPLDQFDTTTDRVQLLASAPPLPAEYHVQSLPLFDHSAAALAAPTPHFTLHTFTWYQSESS